jgi:proteasome lid subunit RPN8/RPN11
MPTVYVKKSQLDYFRSLARDTQKEVQAVLVGEVTSPDKITIKQIVHPKEYASQAYSYVQWWADEYNRVAERAAKAGWRIVGDIHSHPNWDAVLSPDDHRNHLAEGYRVSGICSTQGRKTRVRFWLAESCLPCKIEYL